jgi:hypothetical protein
VREKDFIRASLRRFELIVRYFPIKMTTEANGDSEERWGSLMRSMGMVIMVMGALISTGCVDFTGALSARRVELTRERDDLEREVRLGKVKFSELEKLRGELNYLHAKKEQIQSVIKHLKERQ